MAQGIFINGRRPRSKKEVKESLDSVRIEATSMFGNEYDGPAADMPENTTVYFVGPDPYRARNFYGQITKRNGKVTVK